MIVACRHCGEPFEYWEEGTKGWLPKQGVEIICPHCGDAHDHLKTIGYVHSRKLTDEQRAQWNASRSSE